MRFIKKNASIQLPDSNQSRRFTLGQYIAAVSLLLMSVTAISYAAGLLTLIPFKNGSAILSTDVNANFNDLNTGLNTVNTALATAATDNNTKFNSINATLTTLSATVTSLVNQVGGAINATTGNFSGGVSATTGTFSSAVTAPNLFGQGQVWTDVTANRTLAINYLNNTARPVAVAVIMKYASGPGGNGGNLIVDSSVASVFEMNAYSMTFTLSAIVPPGSTYAVNDLRTNGGTSVVSAWRELR